MQKKLCQSTSSGSSAITDFLQIQVAVRKPQLDLYLPNQVGVRAGEGTVPQYTAAMMSEDKIFRYSLPRGGFYEMWIPDPLNNPLDIVYENRNTRKRLMVVTL